MKFEELNLRSIGNTVMMAGGIWSGDGKVLLCLFPESLGEVVNLLSGGAELEVVQMTSENWKAFLRQADTMETEILAKAPDGSLYKAIARKCERTISQQVSWNVYRRDGFKCRYCADSSVPLTVDHLVLWEEGGPSIEENLVAACRKCNKARGNTPYDMWLETPRYKDTSRKLDEATREANRALVATLAGIPRMLSVRSHR